VLLAKTPADMQRMINLLETFGNSVEIKFNPTKTNYMVINGHLKQHQRLLNTTLKMNDLNIEMVSTMKYLGNIVNKTLSNTDHISNRIRLTAAAMFKLNDYGYDESLDAMTIIQLYKIYGRTTLLYGLENLNLEIGETDRVSAFEKAVIKISQICAFSP